MSLKKKELVGGGNLVLNGTSHLSLGCFKLQFHNEVGVVVVGGGGVVTTNECARYQRSIYLSHIYFYASIFLLVFSPQQSS